ncbi:MAG: hypothetical protein LBI91_06890 [Spirochaetaceae bacterium]|jgi:hypothetical protein|nr:hypothetical protein [Spirochaetaceae bacterium]
MSARLVFRGQCLVVSILFLACPLYIPEKVQIKTEPAIYLPLGTPNSLQNHMDFSINDLANSKPALSASGGALALYDYQGEYGDTRAFIIKMKLADIPLETALPPIPPALPGVTVPDIEIDFAKTGISPIADTQAGFELGEILGILGKYDGLQFRSIPVYFYISGPDCIFENGNVTVSIKALDGDNHSVPLEGADLLSGRAVTPQALPVFPDSEDLPMTGSLSPKPGTSFDLKDILNQDNPPGKLDFQYEINIGKITVKYDDLAAIEEDLKTPLSAVLVITIPFQFNAVKDIPILSEKNADPDLKAIHLVEDGKDLFGRVSADDKNGSVQEILERMQSLIIHVNIENNLGLAGYAPIYRAKPDPGNPEENLLGKINLSGLSGVPVSRANSDYPFNVWVEMYFGEGQGFDIKRPSKDPSVIPLKLSLAVTAKTRINETF